MNSIWIRCKSRARMLHSGKADITIWIYFNPCNLAVSETMMKHTFLAYIRVNQCIYKPGMCKTLVLY